MNFKPLTTLLTGVSSLLLIAGSAHAQDYWGAPGLGPYNPQPRYASPCGPGGCSTRNGGCATQPGCQNGVCNQPRSGYYAANCGPRGAGWSNGWQNAGASRGCSNGTCSPQPRYYSNPSMGNAPWDNGYSGYSAPNRVPQEYVAPQGYGSYRPNYQYDQPNSQYEAVPSRTVPQPTRMPRYEEEEYGTNNQRGFETTSVDLSRTDFGNPRSPFYP